MILSRNHREHYKYMYKTKISDPDQKYIHSVKKLKILIVDDEDNSRNSLRDLIDSRGHLVTTLDEGMKCVNRCSEIKFDIIFMDYHINDPNGELDGTDVVRMVRECFDNNSIIYAYTGDSTVKAINDFKKNNLKGALIKPVEPSLINEFFMIIENDTNLDDTVQLSKLAIKRKNFMYFGRKRK
jgi:CheY-like chemotaxis protein